MRRKHGAHFEKHRVAFEEGAGHDDPVVDDGDEDIVSKDAVARVDSVHTDEKKAKEGV